MEFSKNKDLIPKICEVHFATHSQILGYLQGSEPHLVMPLLKEGLWESLYFTADTIDLKGAKQETKHGSLYPYTLSLKYPGFTHTNPHDFAALDHHRWVLALMYDDQSIRLLGSEYSPCTFSWSEMSNPAGFMMEWTCTDTEPSPSVEVIKQFFIDPNTQHLMQRYPDANTYNLTADQHFTGQGPTAHNLEYQEGRLIQSS